MAKLKEADKIEKLTDKTDQELLSMQAQGQSKLGTNETGFWHRAWQGLKGVGVGSAAYLGVSKLVTNTASGWGKFALWGATAVASVGTFLFVNSNHRKDQDAETVQRLQNIEIELAACAQKQQLQGPAYGADITPEDLARINDAMQNRQNAGKFTSQALQGGNGQRAMGV